MTSSFHFGANTSTSAYHPASLQLIFDYLIQVMVGSFLYLMIREYLIFEILLNLGKYLLLDKKIMNHIFKS